MRVIPKQHRGAFDAAVTAQKALNASQERDVSAGTFDEARYRRLNAACNQAMNKLPGWLQEAAFHKAQLS